MSQKLSKEYKDIWKLPGEKVEQFNNDFKYIKKIENEISKMKKGSIALVSQITTISKKRILKPINALDPIRSIKASNEIKDKIDKSIIELFTK